MRRCAIVGFAISLAGCASLLPGGDAGISASPWAKASVLRSPGAAWEHVRFPGKSPVQYEPEQVGGRAALAADARSATSVVRRKVHVEAADLGRLRFSWKVADLIAGADLGRQGADDSPVRVVLAFAGDRSRFSPRDALLSELVRAVTGEEMPYATLMYVWCNQRSPGTLVSNPRTDRIRKLVVESGPQHLGRWLDYERDIRADFERAFGEAPGALVGVAVMTDTDNTRSAVQAWYGPLELLPRR